MFKKMIIKDEQLIRDCMFAFVFISFIGSIIALVALSYRYDKEYTERFQTADRQIIQSCENLIHSRNPWTIPADVYEGCQRIYFEVYKEKWDYQRKLINEFLKRNQS